MAVTNDDRIVVLFPARAGLDLLAHTQHKSSAAIPRTRGARPKDLAEVGGSELYSPHARG